MAIGGKFVAKLDDKPAVTSMSLVLSAIGIIDVLFALNQNSVQFIDGGQHVAGAEISTGLSIGVIAVVMVVTEVASQLQDPWPDVAVGRHRDARRVPGVSPARRWDGTGKAEAAALCLRPSIRTAERVLDTPTFA
ncbi:hypothetical protein ACXDF8_04450 [Mycolicibacterium sp. CBM1]